MGLYESILEVEARLWDAVDEISITLNVEQLERETLPVLVQGTVQDKKNIEGLFSKWSGHQVSLSYDKVAGLRITFDSRECTFREYAEHIMRERTDGKIGEWLRETVITFARDAETDIIGLYRKIAFVRNEQVPVDGEYEKAAIERMGLDVGFYKTLFLTGEQDYRAAVRNAYPTYEDLEQGMIQPIEKTYERTDRLLGQSEERIELSKRIRREYYEMVAEDVYGISIP